MPQRRQIGGGRIQNLPNEVRFDGVGHKCLQNKGDVRCVRKTHVMFVRNATFVLIATRVQYVLIFIIKIIDIHICEKR